MSRRPNHLPDGRPLVLGADLAEVARARHWVGDRMAGCPHDVVSDVVLLTSELVTNALVHGGGRAEVRLAVAEATAHLAVSDFSERQPRRREAQPEDTNGRGLAIVDRVASRWGVEAEADRKTVWCEIDLDRSARDAERLRTTARADRPSHPGPRGPR